MVNTTTTMMMTTTTNYTVPSLLPTGREAKGSEAHQLMAESECEAMVVGALILISVFRCTSAPCDRVDAISPTRR